MKQQVEVNLNLTLWLDAKMDVEDIGVYVRENIYSGFDNDQEKALLENKLLDILSIKEEAEIYEIATE